MRYRIAHRLRRNWSRYAAAACGLCLAASASAQQAPASDLPVYVVQDCCALCPEASNPAVYEGGYLSSFRMLVQGKDGWLFRTEDDLLMRYGLTPESFQAIAGISRFLDTLGVRLVMVPLPPRGLMAWSKLPDSHAAGANRDVAGFSYQALLADLRGRGVALRTGTPVQGITRDARRIRVHSGAGPLPPFDQVVMACHPDQALRLLDRPTPQENAALSAIRFQTNRMILHRDPAQMPRRRAVWSSWVYKADTRRPEPAIGVTYWMNRLQNIPDTDPLFVSLNPSRPVPDHLIYDQTDFRHPVFDTGALAAQRHLREIQGRNSTWFAGAYTRHGFHEDGFASAVRITRQMERHYA